MQSLEEQLRILFDKPEDRLGLVIIGMGSRDRADDAAGLLIADSLKEKWPQICFSEDERPAESHLFKLSRTRSIEVLILIDAVHFGGMPGSIRLFHKEAFSSVQPAVSTHRVPLSLMMQMVQPTGADIVLLGIQPATTEFMASVSAAVRHAAGILTDLLDQEVKRRSGQQ